jgi:hypothetical protein
MFKPTSNVMSRRRFPRVDVNDQLSIAFTDLDMPAQLRDLSLGGFALETSTPITVGERRRFRIEAAGKPSLLVAMKATYCRPVSDEERYISGWAAETDETTQALDEAVSSLTLALTFDV